MSVSCADLVTGDQLTVGRLLDHFNEGFIRRRWCTISSIHDVNGILTSSEHTCRKCSSWLNFHPLGILFMFLHPSYLKNRTGRMWDVLRGKVSPITWILQRGSDRVRDMRELSCSRTNFKIDNQKHGKQNHFLQTHRDSVFQTTQTYGCLSCVWNYISPKRPSILHGLDREPIGLLHLCILLIPLTTSTVLDFL